MATKTSPNRKAKTVKAADAFEPIDDTKETTEFAESDGAAAEAPEAKKESAPAPAAAADNGTPLNLSGLKDMSIS